MNKEELCVTMRRLRIQSRLTTEEVSKMTGIPQSTLSHWENGCGRPEPLSFLRLCKLYGVNDVYDTFGEQPSDSQGVTTVNVFGTEQKVLDAYRKADYGTKKIIEKILDVQAEPATTEKNA